jgi:hypothetical protein
MRRWSNGDVPCRAWVHLSSEFEGEEHPCNVVSISHGSPHVLTRNLPSPSSNKVGWWKPPEMSEGAKREKARANSEYLNALLIVMTVRVRVRGSEGESEHESESEQHSPANQHILKTEEHKLNTSCGQDIADDEQNYLKLVMLR